MTHHSEARSIPFPTVLNLLFLKSSFRKMCSLWLELVLNEEAEIELLGTFAVYPLAPYDQ